MSALAQRQWFYHPDGRHRIFEPGEAHPGEGWCESAAEAGLVPVAHPDRDTVLVPGAKPDGPVEIPAGWASLHWKKQVALAERLGGSASNKDEAAAVIEAALITRAEA